MLTNKYTYLDESVITFINNKINNRKDFNEDKFIDWLQSNDVESKNNPSSYVRSCFMKELNDGTFFKSEEEVKETKYFTISGCSFYQFARKEGVDITVEQTGYLDIFFEYLINNKIMTPEEVREGNHKILKFMLDNKYTSGDQFIDLWKNSKTLRNKVIDYQLIQTKYEELIKEWKELMDDIYADRPKEMTLEEVLGYQQ